MTGIELEAALTAFPRSKLCDFATPVHRLPRLERKLNTCPLYIKRDDLNGVGSGGGVIFGVTGGVTEAVLRRLQTGHSRGEIR